MKRAMYLQTVVLAIVMKNHLWGNCHGSLLLSIWRSSLSLVCEGVVMASYSLVYRHYSLAYRNYSWYVSIYISPFVSEHMNIVVCRASEASTTSSRAFVHTSSIPPPTTLQPPSCFTAVCLVGNPKQKAGAVCVCMARTPRLPAPQQQIPFSAKTNHPHAWDDNAARRLTIHVS